MKNYSDEVLGAVGRLTDEEREAIIKIKKSFMIYKDHIGFVRKLTIEQAGRLFMNIMEYQAGEELPFNDALDQILIQPFMRDFSEDDDNYIAVCVRNTLNRNKWKKNGSTSGHQWSPVGTHNDSDSDNHSDNHIDSDNDIDKGLKLKDKYTANGTLEEAIADNSDWFDSLEGEDV